MSPAPFTGTLSGADVVSGTPFSFHRGRPSKRLRSLSVGPNVPEIRALKRQIETALRKRVEPGKGKESEESKSDEDKEGGENKDALEDANAHTVGHQLAARIVDDVRRKIESMARAVKDQDCAVCYLLRGRKRSDHCSGIDCPQGLCGDKDHDWEDFRSRLRFRKHYLCWNCLLPTVSLQGPSKGPSR